MHENGHEGGAHFHMNGFARRLVLKERGKGNSEMANCHYITMIIKTQPLAAF